MVVPFVRSNVTTLKVPIDATQERVWELLTTPAGLARWLPLGCTGEIGPGAEFEMVWNDEARRPETSSHRVTVWEPRRRFSFSWPGVHLSFELSRQANMTVLKLTCTYSKSDEQDDLQTEELVGWTAHLLTLKSVAQEGPDLRTPGKLLAWDKGFVTGF